MEKFLQKDKIFCLVDRCAETLDDMSDIAAIHDALKEVEKLCWSVPLNHQIKTNPCYTLFGTHISSLLILSGKKNALLVPNRDYFNMLSSLIRSDNVLAWSISIYMKKFEKEKKVVFREGVLRLMSGDILLPYAYFSSLIL